MTDPIHVLLIEDNPTDVLLLQETLAYISSAQFNVINAERLSEGLERLSQEFFDVVLLDLSLPDSEGLKTLVRTRKQALHVPIVVLTGVTDEAFGLTALQEGAQDYLVKGQVDGHGLARAIRYAIERKRAEEALEGQRAFLRQVIDINPHFIFAKDRAGRFTLANQAVAAAYGTSVEELIGKTDADFNPDATEVEHFRQDDLEVLDSLQERFIPEEVITDAAGKIRWLQTVKHPIVDKNGQAEQVLGVSTDITARKQAEAEIHRHNRELTLLNQVIAASVIGLEPASVLEIACRELALAFQIPQASAVLFNETKTAADVVAEYRVKGQSTALGLNFPVSDKAILQHILKFEGPFVINEVQHDPRLASFYDLIRQSGLASLLILPLRIDGEVVGCLSLETVELRSFSAAEMDLAWSVADQVAGVLARARLTQTYQRLSAAIGQAVESVIMTDTAGVIIYVNPAFERISGYNRAEVIGQTPRLMQGGQLDVTFYQKLWATISAGQMWQGRFVNKKKDGTLYTVEATIAPVYNENGAIVNYVSVQHDVTRELKLEEQYRQAQKMEAVGRLSGGVAHDFNNLLVVINGYSEMLLTRNAQMDDNTRRKYVEEIHLAGERAAGLTRQLLAFSRQQVLQPEILNLNEVVVNIEKMLRRLISEDIELVAVPDPNLGQVKADPGQIEQVILNLAVNARDAMPQGGKLTIETANVELDETYIYQHIDVTPGAYVMLAVSDTGVGMAAQVQSHIFEPFFTTKERGKGTGLGLATVYGIVKQSGGDIRVYSELEQGTTFKIYLPRTDEAIAVFETRSALSQLPTGLETVLVVEDEDSVRALTRQALELSGYTVLEASRGSEALTLCQQQPELIHLLLTDVVMPGGLNGRELAERLKLTRPELKVLFMSGYTTEAIVHHGVLEPGLFFLQKPFSPYKLIHKVREILDTSLI